MNSRLFPRMILCVVFPALFFGEAYDATGYEISTMVEQFSRFDINADGTDEIDRLEIISEWSVNELDRDATVLFVLIEDRLLCNAKNGNDNGLNRCLANYSRCLSNDGWKPVFLRASVYDGQQHQDGRTVLALRRFFQSARSAYPNFAGAVLIGSFPESMLVRRWVWKHNKRSATFNGVTYNKGNGPKATFVALDPELISHRSDVVLCDLDGNWEQVYVQSKTEIDSIKFLPDERITVQNDWPRFEQTIKTDKFSIRQKAFEDFFFIDDARLKILERTEESLTLKCDYHMQRPEVGESDNGSPNPLAKPDIIVSRINPRHVGVIQPAKNLDAEGKPKAVPSPEVRQIGNSFATVRLSDNS